MNQAKRRSTYQYGTLTQESRRRGSDVWVYRYFETINGKKSRRKRIVGTVQEYPTRTAAERACEHVRMAANAETTTPESPSLGGLIDRYIEQVLRPCLDVPLGGGQDEFAQISYQCAKSYKSTLNRWVRPRWETYRVREFEQPAVRAAIEDWLKSLWRSPKNPHGLAPKMVRSIYNVMKLAFKYGAKWGYLRENPMAEKRVELPRGSTKRTKQPVQLTPAWFFLLLTKLPLRERLAVAFSGWVGPRISEAFGLKCQDLDLDAGVVTFRRGFVQGRITLLKTEASRTNLPLPEDRARPAAPMAVDHSPSNRKRLGVRLAVYQRRTSILACPTAQDSHQTGRSKSGFAEHRMAQFPPHGERLGQRGRVGTGRCQNPIA